MFAKWQSQEGLPTKCISYLLSMALAADIYRGQNRYFLSPNILPALWGICIRSRGISLCSGRCGLGYVSTHFTRGLIFSLQAIWRLSRSTRHCKRCAADLSEYCRCKLWQPSREQATSFFQNSNSLVFCRQTTDGGENFKRQWLYDPQSPLHDELSNVFFRGLVTSGNPDSWKVQQARKHRQFF